jgi:hypothetical protein
MQCAARSSFATSTEQECTTVLDCSGAEAKRRDCPQCAAVHLIFTKKETYPNYKIPLKYTPANGFFQEQKNTQKQPFDLTKRNIGDIL